MATTQFFEAMMSFRGLGPTPTSRIPNNQTTQMRCHPPTTIPHLQKHPQHRKRLASNADVRFDPWTGLLLIHGQLPLVTDTVEKEF